MKKVITFCFLYILAIHVKSQENKSLILENTNVSVLDEYAQKLSDDYAHAHARAIARAIAEGRDTLGVDVIDELGVLRYQVVDNTAAAAATNTDALQIGGSLNLDLDGSGFTVGIWEATETTTSGNIPLTSHFNLNTGSGGPSRVLVQDGSTTASNHATHVAGTIAGDGTDDASATGMATNVTLNAYNSVNDEAEMAAAAAAGMLVSNHSYGWAVGWSWDAVVGCWEWKGSLASYNANTEDENFGRYSEMCRIRDSIAFNAPQYLAVQSSGNDRDDNPVPGASQVRLGDSGPCSTYFTGIFPPQDATGGDNIPTNGVAKNILTVGAIDAASGNALAAFSSVGPTDDGRIKPDIVGHGVQLYSSWSTSNNAYNTIGGTSMATPNVSGSAILLQEHFEDLNGSGNFMNSATLKALIIHTAQDLGNPGPDYSFGWGLMNAEDAANVITDDDANDGSAIIEDTQSGISKQYGFLSSCAEDLQVTMAYTDLPGTIQTTLDNTTPNLVNDLDIFLLSANQNDRPWILDPNNINTNATTGDNDVDNVEQIISSPDQNLQVLQVNREGSLTGGSQDFSLIATNFETTCEVIVLIQGGTTLTQDENYCSTLAYTSSANIPTGRTITYTNPSRIIFTPGFSAASGSNVRAHITEACQ